MRLTVLGLVVGCSSSPTSPPTETKRPPWFAESSGSFALDDDGGAIVANGEVTRFDAIGAQLWTASNVSATGAVVLPDGSSVAESAMPTVDSCTTVVSTLFALDADGHATEQQFGGDHFVGIVNVADGFAVFDYVGDPAMSCPTPSTLVPGMPEGEYLVGPRTSWSHPVLGRDFGSSADGLCESSDGLVTRYDATGAVAFAVGMPGSGPIAALANGDCLAMRDEVVVEVGPTGEVRRGAVPGVRNIAATDDRLFALVGNTIVELDDLLPGATIATLSVEPDSFAGRGGSLAVTGMLDGDLLLNGEPTGISGTGMFARFIGVITP